LSIAGYPQVVQTSVGDQIIPFLRAKTICGRLGATIIDGLTGGNLRLPPSGAYVCASRSAREADARGASPKNNSSFTNHAF
jgi:hypothetical protein